MPFIPDENQKLKSRFIPDEPDDRSSGPIYSSDLPLLEMSPEESAKYGRPLLEGGGMLLGSAIGTAGGTFVAPGPGTVAGGITGAGTGYAAGKNIADYLEGKSLPDDKTELATQLGKDVLTGAAYETGGLLAGKALGYLGKKSGVADWLYSRALKSPRSKDWATIVDSPEGLVTDYERAVTAGRKAHIKPYTKEGFEAARNQRLEIGKKIEERLAKIERSDDYRGLDEIFGDTLHKEGSVLDNIPAGEDMIKDLRSIRKYVEKYFEGKSVQPTAKELNNYKNALYEQIKWSLRNRTGNATINQLRKDLAREMRIELEKMAPEIRGLNFDYHNFDRLEQAIEYTIGKADKESKGLYTDLLKLTVNNKAANAKLSFLVDFISKFPKTGSGSIVYGASKSGGLLYDKYKYQKP